jgi:hypothetical protein
VKGWFSARNDASAEWVFTINAVAALLAGLWALKMKLPPVVALAIGAAAFVALTAALLRRGTAIVATLAGASLVGVVAGLLGAAFLAPGVAPFGGVVIGAGGFASTFWLYRRLVRATTGAGGMEGRYVGTFNERDRARRQGSGAATVLVTATEAGEHDLRVSGLVVGGVSVELVGARREEETVIADLTYAGSATASFDLIRGKAILDGAMLIVDLEGVPFGTYVFTGQRETNPTKAPGDLRARQ